MRAKQIAALLAATAILVALGPPTGATAARPTHRVRQPASAAVSAEGHGTDGFGFNFYLDARTKMLLMTKRISQAGVQAVSYISHHPGGNSGLEGRQLDVRIGGLGRFRAHFVPTSTKTQQPERGCTGDPTTIEKGVFVGSFAFHGERGYADISSHREHATITRQGATSCPVRVLAEARRHRRPPRPTKEQRQREEGEFRLVAGRADAHLVFQAQREEPPEPEEGSPTNFEASTYSHVGELEVVRAAVILDVGQEDAATILAPSATAPLTEATVTPPAPFSGSATFHLDDPRTASWTGDLAVELPGLGAVPLTGGDIEAGLCNGASHCTKTVSGTLKKVLEISRESDSSGYVSGKATTEPSS